MQKHNVITADFLRDSIINLQKGENDDFFSTFIMIHQNIRNDQLYFQKNEELSTVLFTEMYPSFFQFVISRQNYQFLISLISLYVDMCNYMLQTRMYSFIPFMSNLFDVLDKKLNNNVIYFIDEQIIIKNVKNNCNSNIFIKYYIEKIVDMKIIKAFIQEILNNQYFTQQSYIFDIFNKVFPSLNKEILNDYEHEFSNFPCSINDQYYSDCESIYLTKAMTACSIKFATLHFENLIKFIKIDDKQAKHEFLILIKNSENLKALSNKIKEEFNLIFDKLKNENKILSDICAILSSNNIISKNYLIEKVGTSLSFNLSLFAIIKDDYTTEKVTKIIESETFCEQTVDFEYKIIEYKIGLLSNLSLCLKKSFSSFWKDERMNTIVALSKSDANRQILLDSIKDYIIENRQEFQIILQVLILLKPTTEEFNYDNFVNEILNYTDSLLILSFLKSNHFIPINSIDIELLISYSIFNEEFADFLFKNFADSLIEHVDFLLTFQIDDDDANDQFFCSKSSNKIYGRFLFDLFKMNNSSDSRLIWESVIRLKDEDEEVHQAAQKIINENPEKSQEEIIEKVENGYSKYFVNFDFSTFSEISAEDNGNCLFFGKPQIASMDSLFYFSTKVMHALNHSEEIEEQDVSELFEFRICDVGIDAIILKTAFDAVMKISISFPLVEESLNVSLELKYRSFLDQIVNYVINSQEEVVSFNEELLNSLSQINENYVVDLASNKKIQIEVLSSYFSKYQTPQSLSLLRRVDFEIPIELFNQIIYTKRDFIAFCESNRIKLDEILPFVFSSNFPQFYRTKKIINFVFHSLKSNPIFLLNFLKSIKWNNLDINGIVMNQSSKSTQSYNAYLAFAFILPDFSDFPDQNFGSYLSNVIYNRNADLQSPLSIENELDKGLASESVVSLLVDWIMNELPNKVLKQFELLMAEKDYSFFSKSEIFHCFSINVREKSVSEELAKLELLNRPRIILFRILQNNKFEIEETIKINEKQYHLSSILTNSNLFIYNSNHQTKPKYKKWSNGVRSYAELIEGDPLFIFYELFEKENDDYRMLKNRFNKFRKAKYIFNQRTSLNESLNKADVDWRDWKQDDTLFGIATILLSEVGYTQLFKDLSQNVQFSEYFFKSDWKDQLHIQSVNNELINLAKIYPRRDELFSILLKSIHDDDRSHFISLILASFDLDENSIEKVVNSISPTFDQYEDLILNFYVKPTSTNALLAMNPRLADFVFSRIEKRTFQPNSNYQDMSSLPFCHLLQPMSGYLFVVCMKCLSRSSMDLIKEAFQMPVAIILASLRVVVPHNDALASVFCQISPSDSSDDFRSDVQWVEYALASENSRIRRHSFILIRSFFMPKDSNGLLKVALEKVIINVLSRPYFGEVTEFIFGFFGHRFCHSTDFTEKFLIAFFNSDPSIENNNVFTSMINSMKMPLKSSMPMLYQTLRKNRKKTRHFIFCGNYLLLVSISIMFNPPHMHFFIDLLKTLMYSHHVNMYSSFFQILPYQVTNSNVASYFNLIIEFIIVLFLFIPFVRNNLMTLPNFYETEMVMVALILPIEVINKEALIVYAMDNITDQKKLMAMAIETANIALKMIIGKKALLRKSEKTRISKVAHHYYTRVYCPFFSNRFFRIFELLSKSSHDLKNAIKYVTMSSLAFRDILRNVFETVSITPGLNFFKDDLKFVETEWSELICEVAREILSDIEFNTAEYRKSAVSIVDRELCCQLYRFSSAEKLYLRFMIGVMKNDELREECEVRCNNQIFNVFRNDFVMFIDDVSSFIEISLKKFDDFFNEDEIKKFILKLKINDIQIKQKLRIVLSLFENRQNNMVKIVEEIFPILEELNSANDLDDELTDIMNNVFEQSLITLSLL